MPLNWYTTACMYDKLTFHVSLYLDQKAPLLQIKALDW